MGVIDGVIVGVTDGVVLCDGSGSFDDIHTPNVSPSPTNSYESNSENTSPENSITKDSPVSYETLEILY